MRQSGHSGGLGPQPVRVDPPRRRRRRPHRSPVSLRNHIRQRRLTSSLRLASPPRKLPKGNFKTVRRRYHTDTEENIRQRLHECYPTEKPGAVPNIIGRLKRFSCQVQVGDHFVTYDPERRLYHIGTVESGQHLRQPGYRLSTASSRALGRLAALTSIPPYLDFHR